MTEKFSRPTATRTRMGRPPLPHEVARSDRVVTFVNSKELAELTRGAENADASLSSYVHELLFRRQQRRGA